MKPSQRHHLKTCLIGLGLGLSFSLPDALISAAHSHGAHGGAGGEQLEPGEFQAKPIITIEGHGGFENNLVEEGQPQHYAIDGLFGVVFEWGLENGGSFSIEAQAGPALVYGEAEHFYGLVHDHGDEHEKHGEHAGHGDHAGHDHAHEDDHDHEEDDHDHDEDDHDEDHDHEEDDHDHKKHRAHALAVARAHHELAYALTTGEGHGHDDHDHGHESGAPYRRTDVKGYLDVRYAPNDRLAFNVTWKPYYVTADQGEDVKGLKNELHFGGIYAFGDGDVNFALGDGLETIADGIFISAKNATGWESDGMYVGNYTDVWPGFGFNYDLLNVTISGGPRFYTPGSYAKLPSRTDWGGELALEYPLSKNAVLFAHWEPMYSTKGGEGWGKGFQHHVGTGVTFSF